MRLLKCGALVLLCSGLVGCGDDEQADPRDDLLETSKAADNRVPSDTLVSGTLVSGKHDVLIEKSVTAFQGRDRVAWLQSVDALYKAGPTIVPDLLKLMKHGHRGVREWVVHALGDLAPKRNDAVVDALLAALEDPDDYVVLKAARALGRIGPDAFRALPALRKIAIANLEALSGTAEMAIQRIDPHPD